MRAVGIDLGSKRIGIAVSDADQTVATPLTTVLRTKDVSAHRTAITRLVDEWEAGVVVVGMPTSLSGDDGPAAAAARAEIDALRGMLSVPVETIDERLTTVVADQRLRESGISGRARAAIIDQTAAAVLLQDWLDSRRGPRG